MRTLTSVVLLICVTVSPAAARHTVGHIGAYTNYPGLNDCVVYDTAPGTQTIYIAITLSPEAGGCRFRLVTGEGYGGGVTMTLLSETHHFPSVGNVEDGLTVCFDQCMPLPVVVATLTYTSYGTSAPCSYIAPAPHPAAITLELVDCDGNYFATSCSKVHLNPIDCYCLHGGSSCPTGSGPAQPFNCDEVATDQSTWGLIKSLYQ